VGDSSRYWAIVDELFLLNDTQVWGQLKSQGPRDDSTHYVDGGTTEECINQALSLLGKSILNDTHQPQNRNKTEQP